MAKGLTWRRRLLIYLGVMGPGLITANADNDAGGITTYSVVGAHFGYSMLWALFLVTLCLMVTQEIGARTGAVTGKGLAALIRENYGVRITLFAMLTMVVANSATTVSEFAGIAAATELFGLPKIATVPLAAAAVWLLVIRGNYKLVERIFLGFSLVYGAYILSGFLANPPWAEVIRATFTPSFALEAGYLLTLVAMIGTTITPWGQFFIQAYVVDKGVTPDDYHYTRLDVLTGAVITDLIAFFIIVATAATLHVQGIHIEDAADAARALAPLAGPLAQAVFAVGLLNASLLAASIVPLATAYAVCEAFGWEAGVDRSFSEAPVFNGLYTFTVALGAAVVLIPGLPLIGVMLLAQTVNGILLPIILFFAVRLASDQELMGKYANPPWLNVVAWATAGGVVLLTLILLGTTAWGLIGAGG